MDAAPASAAAPIGARKTTPSAVSMMIPIPGMLLMSTGDRRIARNRSQIVAQTARQAVDAALKTR